MKISVKSVSVIVMLFLNGTCAAPYKERYTSEPLRQVAPPPEVSPMTLSLQDLSHEDSICAGNTFKRECTPPLMVTRTNGNGQVFVANQSSQVEVSRGSSSIFTPIADRRATPAVGAIGVAVAGEIVIATQPIQEINISRSMPANLTPIANRRITAPLNAELLFPNSTRGSTEQLGDASYFVRGSCPAEALDSFFYRNLKGDIKLLREKVDQNSKRGKSGGIKVRRLESSVAFLNWDGNDIPLEYTTTAVGSVKTAAIGSMEEGAKPHFKVNCIYEKKEHVLKIYPGDSKKAANCFIAGFNCELQEIGNGKISFIDDKWELLPVRSNDPTVLIMELRGITLLTKAVEAMEKLCMSIGSKFAKPGRRVSKSVERFENRFSKSLSQLTGAQPTDIGVITAHETPRV